MSDTRCSILRHSDAEIMREKQAKATAAKEAAASQQASSSNAK